MSHESIPTINPFTNKPIPDGIDKYILRIIQSIWESGIETHMSCCQGIPEFRICRQLDGGGKKAHIIIYEKDYDKTKQILDEFLNNDIIDDIDVALADYDDKIRIEFYINK